MTTNFRDLLAALSLLTLALGLFLCAFATVVACSPYLLVDWIWGRWVGEVGK